MAQNSVLSCDSLFHWISCHFIGLHMKQKLGEIPDSLDGLWRAVFRIHVYHVKTLSELFIYLDYVGANHFIGAS